MTGPRLENNGDSEARPRTLKHIPRACMGCRKRKVRCDGTRPRCANCVLHDQECTFSQELDRRKVASKSRMSAVVAYVQELESLLLTRDISLPESRPGYLLPSLPSPSSGSPRPATVPGLEPPSSRGPGISAPSTEHSRDISRRLSVSSESSSAVNSLSDRIGSLQIAEDGQLRFFGPTSNLHISHVGTFPLFNSNIRSIYRNEALILNTAGVGQHVDEELENHLIKLYFTWEDPTIPIVDKESYYCERYRYRQLNQPSHRYSEVLTNAM